MAARYCSRSVGSICCNHERRRLSSRIRAKYFFGKLVETSRCDVRSALENDHRIPDAHQLFDSRSIPVGQTNTAVTRGTADRLGIVRAMNADAGLIQAHPE